ncbi:MAG: hypothetical protein M1819_003026 [Sarea resinae]|nr:MAG: hypothetical protein M1819_003026 [Sarea resinae]
MASKDRRTRASKPKTRTGCRTCKTRRVKCDEQKPECQRCVSTGRKCSGYDTTHKISSSHNQRPIFPHVKSNGDRDVSTASSDSVRQPPPPPASSSLLSRRQALCQAYTGKSLIATRPSTHILLQDSVESRGYDFFRLRTRVELPGLFQSDLWSYLLLQLSHSEPAIHHAVIAVGSLHERQEKSDMAFETAVIEDMTDPSYRFCLQQHHAAVYHLYSRLRKQDRNSAVIALVTCFLFICFEFLRRRIDDASAHLRSGVKILLEMLSRGRAAKADVDADTGTDTNMVVISTLKPSSVEEDLLDLFARLDIQSTMCGSKTLLGPLSVQNPDRVMIGSKSLLGPITVASPTWVEEDQIPESFTSLVEAQRYLAEHINCALRSFNTRMMLGLEEQDHVDPQRQLERDRQLSRFTGWLAAYNNFLQHSSRHLTSKELLLADFLRLKYLNLFVMLSHCLDGGVQMTTDQHNLEFKTMLSLAENIVNSAENPRSFQMDMGPLACVFYTALKCRDPPTRHRAVELLLSKRRREGLFDSFVMGRFVAAVVKVEERGYEGIKEAAELPESARIGGVEGELTEDQTTLILDCRRREPGTDIWVSWNEYVPVRGGSPQP